MSNVNLTIRGKSSYAKILEDQLSLNYGKDAKEWKLDLVISPETVKELEGYGVGDRVKIGTKSNPDYLGKRPYITLKQREFTRAGKANQPIKVVDITDAPWDQTKRIGNESDVDVSVSIVEYGDGLKPGMYIRKVRVLNLVPYEADIIKPIDESDPFYEKLAAAQAEAAMRAAEESCDRQDDDDDLPI